MSMPENLDQEPRAAGASSEKAAFEKLQETFENEFPEARFKHLLDISDVLLPRLASLIAKSAADPGSAKLIPGALKELGVERTEDLVRDVNLQNAFAIALNHLRQTRSYIETGETYWKSRISPSGFRYVDKQVLDKRLAKAEKQVREMKTLGFDATEVPEMRKLALEREEILHSMFNGNETAGYGRGAVASEAIRLDPEFQYAVETYIIRMLDNRRWWNALDAIEGFRPSAEFLKSDVFKKALNSYQDHDAWLVDEQKTTFWKVIENAQAG